MFNKLYKKLAKEWSNLSKKRQVFYFITLSLLLILIIIPFSVKAGTLMGAIASLFGIIIGQFITFLSKIITLEINIFAKFAQFNTFLDVTAVKEGWKLVRDVCNMFFILILLMISFATILKIESYAYKKWLGRLVIAAILINFSKTITGLLIGFSQVVMLTFVSAFKEAVAGNLGEGLHLNEMMSASASGELSRTYGENVALNDDTFKDDSLDAAAVFGALLLALILLTVFAIIMLIIIVILVGRIVTLWVLVILSPIAYLLQASPFGAKYAKQWWQELGKNLVSGPVLAFFLWLAFLTIQRSSGRVAADMDAGYTNQTVDEFSDTKGEFLTGISKTTYLMDYIVTIALLLAAIKLTQSMGVIGSSFAGKMQQGMSKAARGATNGIIKSTTKGAGLAIDRGISTNKFGAMVGQFIPGTTANKVRKKVKVDKEKSYRNKTESQLLSMSGHILTDKGGPKFQKVMFSTLAESGQAAAEDGYGPVSFIKKVGRIRGSEKAEKDIQDINESINENNDIQKYIKSDDSMKSLRISIDLKNDLEKRNKKLEKDEKAQNSLIEKLEKEKNEEGGRDVFAIDEEIENAKIKKNEIKTEIETNENSLKENNKKIESEKINLEKHIDAQKVRKLSDLKTKRDKKEISNGKYKKEKERIENNYGEMSRIVNDSNPIDSIEKISKSNQTLLDNAEKRKTKQSPYFRIDAPSMLVGGREEYKNARDRYKRIEGASGNDQSKLLEIAIEENKGPSIDVILNIMAEEGNIDSAISLFKDENGDSLTNDANGLREFMNQLKERTSMSDQQIGHIFSGVDKSAIKGGDLQYGRLTAYASDGSVKILDKIEQEEAMSSYINYVKQGRLFAQSIKKGLIINNKGEINQIGLKVLKKSGKSLKKYTSDMNADVLGAISSKYDELLNNGVDKGFLDDIQKLIEDKDKDEVGPSKKAKVIFYDHNNRPMN